MSLKKTLVAAVIASATALVSPVLAQTSQDTYLGKLTFQNQTITKETAEKLHEQISLHIEPNPPAANFWSVTVYDIENRLIIRNQTRRSGRSSRTEGLIKNDDGSVDLYFDQTFPMNKIRKLK